MDLIALPVLGSKTCFPFWSLRYIDSLRSVEHLGDNHNLVLTIAHECSMHYLISVFNEIIIPMASKFISLGSLGFQICLK